MVKSKTQVISDGFLKNKKMNIFKITVFTIFLLNAFALSAQEHSLKIIPEPLQAQVNNGSFTLKKEHAIYLDTNFLEAQPEVKQLQQLIVNKAKIDLPIVNGDSNKKVGIHVFRDPKIKNKEGYVLDIAAGGIHLSAAHRTGLFYGIQTLAQIFPVPIENISLEKLPFLSITDSPRFPYRSLMLDPARHFLPIAGIKKYIDVMAAYKYNHLHLHLTDDQGWRIEIKEYPLLTEIGSKRKETDGDSEPHSGFYTQEELEDLVAYARTKHVKIIPEIDMPGHGLSILAAYPNLACFPMKFEVSTVPGVSKELLCAGKKEVYEFYEHIISEVASIFPNTKMHIGGDEAPLDQWEKCPNCQKTMQENSLEKEEELMAYFFDRINKILINYDKEPLLWYESNVENYPKNSTVILWRYEEPDAKLREIQSRGLKMINSYGGNVYFDYPQWKGDIPKTNWMNIISVEKTYAFDPVRGLPEDESKFIIGVEGCVWGEYVPNIDRAFYMTYPRALALAEAGWSTNKNRSWENFQKKLDKHFVRFISEGINFRPPIELSKK